MSCKSIKCHWYPDLKKHREEGLDCDICQICKRFYEDMYDEEMTESSIENHRFFAGEDE